MGLFSSGSSKRAAQVQADKLAEANRLLGAAQEEYGAYYDPYMSAGTQAISDAQYSTGLTQDYISGLTPKIEGLEAERAALQPQVSEMYTLSQQMDPVVQELLGGGQGFTTSPGYQFALEEGKKALERSRAAQGTLNQGATGKELIRYSQGMADQEYQNYLNNLYNQLGAVNTQLGGRTSALNAGQSQINQGLNVLGADYQQIQAQQNLTNQYQNLINQGMSAADAAARLGMTTAQQQAANTAQQGDVYASGMTAKSNQLLGLGESIVNAGSAAAAAAMGLPPSAAPQFNLTGSPSTGQSSMPQYNTTTAPMQGIVPQGSVDIGNQMPWLSDSSGTTAARTLSQSGY